MKIATEVVWQITESGMVEVSRSEFDYSGPLALCGGGPDKTQQAQEQASANLANTQAAAGKQALDFTTAQQSKVDPFFTGLMQNGDPNFNAETDQSGGVLSRAYAPARAQLERSLSTYGSLPSGYADAARRDLSTSQARDYDSQLTGLLDKNLATREAGASGVLGNAQVLTPASLFGGANASNNTVMATPRKPGLGGLLGGVAGSLAGGIGQAGGVSSFFG